MVPQVRYLALEMRRFRSDLAPVSTLAATTRSPRVRATRTVLSPSHQRPPPHSRGCAFRTRNQLRHRGRWRRHSRRCLGRDEGRDAGAAARRSHGCPTRPVPPTQDARNLKVRAPTRRSSPFSHRLPRSASVLRQWSSLHGRGPNSGTGPRPLPALDHPHRRQTVGPMTDRMALSTGDPLRNRRRRGSQQVRSTDSALLRSRPRRPASPAVPERFPGGLEFRQAQDPRGRLRAIVGEHLPCVDRRPLFARTGPGGRRRSLAGHGDHGNPDRPTVPTRDSGRADRSRTGRRHPDRGVRAPSRPPARGGRPPGSGPPRPSTEPAPASRARRLVRPTTRRSVAVAATAAPNARFSSNCRAPSSTMPGVTTTDPMGPEVRVGGGLGHRGRQSAAMQQRSRPDSSCRCRRGSPHPGAERTACNRWSTGGSSPKRECDGPRDRPRGPAPRRWRRQGWPAARRPGSRPPRPGRSRRRRPTSVADPVRTTQTSADGSAPEHRSTRFPCACGPVGQRRQTRVVHLQDHDIGRPDDLRLGLEDPVLRPEPLEMDRADGGDHGDARWAPTA